MNWINYTVKIDPRAHRTINGAGREVDERLTNDFLIRVSNNLLKNMKMLAPYRSGKLRAGIKLEYKEKSGGTFDRRAKIKVTSTAPHSRYVVGGVNPSIGDGTPGSGRFVGTKGKFRRGSKNFKGGIPNFRSRYGKYPGFPANDFVSAAAEKTESEVLNKYGSNAIDIYARTYKALGLMFK